MKLFPLVCFGSSRIIILYICYFQYYENLNQNQNNLSFWINMEEKRQSTYQTHFMLKSGLVGAFTATFIHWNRGKLSKIGAFFRKWKLCRNFILPKRTPFLPQILNYNTPKVDGVLNNFLCYSGQPGIGKSYYFQRFCGTQSKIRPIFYLNFKAIGSGPDFERQVATQAGLKNINESSTMFTQIIIVAKKIGSINKSPHKLWLQVIATHLIFFACEGTLFLTNIFDPNISLLLLGISFGCQIHYINFMQPFIIQSIRRTIPLLILDDLSKLSKLNMISEVARFLMLMQNDVGNVILISSDEDVWAELRKEAGLKDRLRTKQIKYMPYQTGQLLIKHIQSHFKQYMSSIFGHQMYTKQIVIHLIDYLIKQRQITLRRFNSLLKLNDQQQYDNIIRILQNKEALDNRAIVQKIGAVFFDNQMETMVANLKRIKRDMNTMTNEQFIKQLNILVKKQKLPSDHKLGSYLQLYSIVRQCRSEYVFNGTFMHTVYQLAVKQYIKDLKQYEQLGTQPVNKQ